MKKLIGHILILSITVLFVQAGQRQSLYDFLPQGYLVFEKIYGDLNDDGMDDCVIIIKGTDKSKIVHDKYRGKLDLNRRGIIVLIYKKDHYELALRNEDCFSSESEDGGAYFAPELTVNIKKENLNINYSHGRYGYWTYVFRFQDSDLKLIGYDKSINNGPIVNKEISINFLTKKKIVKENTNENSQGEDEVFHITKSKISTKELIKLSDIIDFDKLRISEE